MEPMTHFMTGAVLARAGLNRKAAYATLAMTLAAEAPDLDTLWGVQGPVAAFEHHRGITHTFVGLPVEAGVVVGVMWLLHRWRNTRAAREELSERKNNTAVDQAIVRPLTAAPVRWGVLYGFVLLALLSHIFLDWTNNYGIRPFFPFNPHWYAGSFVFIFEPVLFAILLVALVAPALFGLVSSEVGSRRNPFRGRGWAIAALIAMAALWGLRYLEHDNAVRIAAVPVYGPDATVTPDRISVNPYPIDPFRWHIVADTPAFYQLGTVDTGPGAGKGLVDTSPIHDILYKPPATLATLVAKRSALGQVYLDWSSFPIVTDLGATYSLPDGVSPTPLTAVQFADPRFMYDVPFMDGRQHPPLTGTAYVDLARAEGERVVRMQMDGSGQRK